MQKHIGKARAQENLVVDLDGLLVFANRRADVGVAEITLFNASGYTLSAYVGDSDSMGFTHGWARQVKLNLQGARPKLKIRVRCASLDTRYQAIVPLRAELGDDSTMYFMDDQSPIVLQEGWS